MTINAADNSPRIEYSVAQGVTQTTFTVPFEFFDTGDINVYVDGVLKAEGSDYTVTGGEGSTGSVIFVEADPTEIQQVTGATGGSQVVITRDIPIERTTDFNAGSDINRAALNEQLDTIIALIADVDDKASRTIQLTDYDIPWDLTLPNKDSLKGNVLAFHATTGSPIVGPTVNEVLNAEEYSVESAANASAAASSASAAASSASSASSSATAAAASESAAATSESNAASSASAASTSETNAASSASTASTAATTATTQASAASSSATAAAASASAASTSETNAASSASSAATSASAASASQTAAAASAAAAAASYDTFDDRYLGSKTSDPTLDNDGNALVAGALYFNSTANEMRVYDGANWIAASSAGGASLLNYNYTATAGQTTFSGADDNAATLSYTQQNLIVTLNGIVLEDGTDYTASNGTSIVLSTGAAAGDELNIVAFKSFTTADMVPASTGGTFSAPVTVNGNNTAVLTVDRATSEGTLVDFKKDGITVGNLGVGLSSLSVGTGNTQLLFWNSQSGIFPSNGATVTDNSIDFGNPNYRFKDLYLSGGVYLGGTGAANYLDDYETGTWTPSIGGSGSGGSYSLGIAVGLYTKIGRLVKVDMRFVVSSVVSAGTGYMQIYGLPFTKANNGMLGDSGVRVRNTVGAPSYDWPVLEMVSSGSTNVAYVFANQVNGSGFDLPISSVQANTEVAGHILYEV